jgi:hypothetical protein
MFLFFRNPEEDFQYMLDGYRSGIMLRSSEEWTFQIGATIDAVLSYYAFRGLIVGKEDFQWFLCAFTVLLVPYAALVVSETVTSENPFARLGGVEHARIVVDPGFGFGKTLAHNLTLLRSLGTRVATGYPVVAGLSRKGSLGEITGRSVDERMPASLAAALSAVAHGAAVVRVHDVRETVDALKVWCAVGHGGRQEGV